MRQRCWVLTGRSPARASCSSGGILATEEVGGGKGGGRRSLVAFARPKLEEDGAVVYGENEQCESSRFRSSATARPALGLGLRSARPEGGLQNSDKLIRFPVLLGLLRAMFQRFSRPQVEEFEGLLKYSS